jgi:hypothetical protein
MKETVETKMAHIVDDILPKLIDVCSSTSHVHSNNTDANESTAESHDLFKQCVYQSISSTNAVKLPDVGLVNLPSLLADRPISTDMCNYVAHTAGELSRLFINEIRIVHREDLVVIFE